MDGLVTLFGGGGFLGRYVVQELLRAGARVRVASRDPAHAYFLKPLGGLGQTQSIAADVTVADSARRAVEGSQAVVNLVGVLDGAFDRIHVAGARNVAAAAAAAGAASFVQVSAIGADAESPSGYARSKGLGEAAAREAFPGATVIRPSILFGPEDDFVNRFARMASLLPVLPVVRGTARFQPAWVGDVARAIALAATDPGRHGGHAYELGGPDVIDMAGLNRWVADAIGAKPLILPVPDPIAKLGVRATGWLPGAPMTWDQWLMLQEDNVVAAGAPGFDAFGIAPKPLSAVAPSWLVRFRRNGRFSLDAA